MFPLKNTRKNSLGIQTTNCLNSQPEHCCLKERGCLVQLQRFSNTCLDISVMGLVWTSQSLTRQLQKHGVTASCSQLAAHRSDPEPLSGSSLLWAQISAPAPHGKKHDAPHREPVHPAGCFKFMMGTQH